MVHVVSILGKTVALKYNEIPSEIQVNELTSIEYSNIYGEMVTVSTAMNSVGMLRAEVEHILKLKKLETDIFEAELKKERRKEASKQAGKFYVDDGKDRILVKLTEGSLSEAVMLNPDLRKLKEACYQLEKDFAYLDSLQWSVQSKSKKLDKLMKEVTPTEFIDGLIDGKVNGILIRSINKRKQ